MYQTTIERTGLSQGKVLKARIAGNKSVGLSTSLILAAILCVSLLCVWTRAKAVSLGYEISRESRHLFELRDANEKLRAEVARLKAPGRLEKIARKRLKLAPPKNDQIIVLK